MNQKNSSVVLVTGGAGYIGSILCSYLFDHGYTVRIFDSMYFGDAPIRALKKKIQVVKGDIRKPPSRLFYGVESVIHLAALSNDPTAEFNPLANMQINTEGATTIASSAKQAGVKRFILASSCSIYDMGLECDTSIKNEVSRVFPKNPYSLSKYLAEQSVLALCTSKFAVTVLRKGTVHGFSPRLRYDLIVNAMVRDALRSKSIKVFCRGRQWRPLIAIEDVAEAYQLTLAAPTQRIAGQIINISQQNYLVKDVAGLVRTAFDDIYGIPIHIAYEQDDKPDRSYRVSTKKAELLLGFYPKHTIRHTVNTLVDMIRKKARYAQYDSPIYYNIKQMKPILERMSTRL